MEKSHVQSHRAEATFLFDGGYKALTRDEENNCSENTSEEASAQVDDTQSKSTEGDKDAGKNVKR
ncbi:hypothetical protein SAMN05216391_11216 [Lachnospiraceae bacterium KHCPX20]|nr:hypothetical protein SAMN05216391_11216 [Lachnospiraceae bacterium KHCPX20]